MMSRTGNWNVAAGDTTKGVKERIVDIYVSVESLFVYDKPWMEGDSKGAAVNNEYSEVAEASGQKKACRIRAVLPWLLVVLLLVVVTGLGIALKEEQADNFNQTSTLMEVLEKLCEQMGCTHNWKKLPCSCYSICPQIGSQERKSSEESGKDCVCTQADLASITTREEQEIVSRLSSDKPAWVGLKRNDDGVCHWVDGTRLPTKSFGHDSPEEEPCALRPLSCFACSSKQNWICEKIIE
ncbi:C-type lectin domain family 2 member B-like [Gadus chalcogrammus]|uniref:C-type lectin domain family 2 member B-like n=1 Tax=Gadus chalcogrammus TaxID=1042646 RepID=UPI0024C2F875|nr:C-type lectin domain family 2 member B-like [Gadus chalcogrammus]